MAAASASVKQSGFSQKTCSPAASAASTVAPCSGSGTATSTASSGAARSSAAVSKPRTPWRSAIAARTRADGSATPASSKRSARCRRLGMCSTWAIIPAPTTPMRSRRSATRAAAGEGPLARALALVVRPRLDDGRHRRDLGHRHVPPGLVRATPRPGSQSITITVVVRSALAGPSSASRQLLRRGRQHAVRAQAARVRGQVELERVPESSPSAPTPRGRRCRSPRSRATRDSAADRAEPALSIRTTIRRTPSWIEVAISDDIISHEPSPTITNTSRSGSASFTPRPPGTS